MPADSANIFMWRNDPKTRAMSRSGAIVSDQSHSTWFSAALEDPDRILLVAEQQELGAVGVLRFDRLSELRWELSINLDPRVRGKGVGQACLEAALDWAAIQSLAPQTIIAEIHKDNVASRRAFEAVGFTNVCGEERDSFHLFEVVTEERNYGS